MTLNPDSYTVPQWTVRDRLRKAREEAYPHMGQIEFAQLLGLGKNIVSAYESPRGTRERNMKGLVLMRWAELTGVPVEWLKSGIVPGLDDDPNRVMLRYQGLTPLRNLLRLKAA